MKVNKKLIPLKVHYFCFLGCMSPVIPFLIVVGLHLGIPVSLMGTLSAVSLLLVVLMKPLIALLADAFPSYRRMIFLMTLAVMTAAFSCIGFIPPAREALKVEGWVINGGERPLGEAKGDRIILNRTVLLTYDDDKDCYVGVAWDCVASCGDSRACPSSSNTTFKVTALDEDRELQLHRGKSEESYNVKSSGEPVWLGDLLRQDGHHPGSRLYEIEGLNVSWDPFATKVSMECQGGLWTGQECRNAWKYWSFWTFAILLFVGNVAFGTANSVTDAIIVDIIAEDSDYGLQRAWGTVGWGLMGPISGLLIDWWSGTTVTKNYWPAFLLCFTLGAADVIISAIFIKVPEVKRDRNIMKKVWPVLRQPKFFIFCCFVVLSGTFDGITASYIFIMQEDMARGTSAMDYMKFLQGLTLFVQCGCEAPFMFVNKWFMRKLGAHYVISLVFFLFVFRLLGLAAVGAYGPVWSVLLVEFLNGPCYGLGYTAIVIHSANISPPGTSTSVQSITNICYESIGYGLAMLMGGLLYSAVGGPMMYLAAGLTAAVTFVLHLISLRLLPPDEDSGDGMKAQPANQISDEENRVLSSANALQSDDEGGSGREKEGKPNEMRFQPKEEVEPSYQLEQVVQRL